VFAEEFSLCQRFADLKNAGDPAAADLLGPRPAVPVEPVTPAEAEHLDVEFFLRRPLQILQVKPARPPFRATDGEQIPRFILTTRGSCASEPLHVQGSTGVDRLQRVVTNPELVVEVRCDRLYGVEVHLRPQ
jgi:hypothetical protein